MNGDTRTFIPSQNTDDFGQFLVKRGISINADDAVSHNQTRSIRRRAFNHTHHNRGAIILSALADGNAQPAKLALRINPKLIEVSAVKQSGIGIQIPQHAGNGRLAQILWLKLIDILVVEQAVRFFDLIKPPAQLCIRIFAGHQSGIEHEIHAQNAN